MSSSSFYDAWLLIAVKNGKLAIEKTPNAVTPILWGSIVSFSQAIVDIYMCCRNDDFWN